MTAFNTMGYTSVALAVVEVLMGITATSNVAAVTAVFETTAAAPTFTGCISFLALVRKGSRWSQLFVVTVAVVVGTGYHCSGLVVGASAEMGCHWWESLVEVVPSLLVAIGLHYIGVIQLTLDC